MAVDKDLEQALDTRIEPWHVKLPGCRGDCQQGRRPCANPEECLPDSPPLTRNGLLLGCAAVALTWIIIGGVAYAVGYVWGLR